MLIPAVSGALEEGDEKDSPAGERSVLVPVPVPNAWKIVHGQNRLGRIEFEADLCVPRYDVAALCSRPVPPRPSQHLVPWQLGSTRDMSGSATPFLTAMSRPPPL